MFIYVMFIIYFYVLDFPEGSDLATLGSPWLERKATGLSVGHELPSPIVPTLAVLYIWLISLMDVNCMTFKGTGFETSASQGLMLPYSERAFDVAAMGKTLGA